jgi:phosphinothricin acetyltransferase
MARDPLQGTIRLVRPDDALAIQEIYAPFIESGPVSFELTVPSTLEIGERIEQTAKTYPWLVYEEWGTVLGYAYASQHQARLAYQWSANVSAYIHERRRGQGVGRALYTSLFALLRLQGYYNVYGGITLPNPASVGLHQAMGMRPVGIYERVGYKMGAWHDVGWWQGTLQPYRLEPSPPLTTIEAQALEEWEKALASGLA